MASMMKRRICIIYLCVREREIRVKEITRNGAVDIERSRRIVLAGLVEKKLNIIDVNEGSLLLFSRSFLLEMKSFD